MNVKRGEHSMSEWQYAWLSIYGTVKGTRYCTTGVLFGTARRAGHPHQTLIKPRSSHFLAPPVDGDHEG